MTKMKSDLAMPGSAKFPSKLEHFIPPPKSGEEDSLKAYFKQLRAEVISRLLKDILYVDDQPNKWFVTRYTALVFCLELSIDDGTLSCALFHVVCCSGGSSGGDATSWAWLCSLSRGISPSKNLTKFGRLGRILRAVVW